MTGNKMTIGKACGIFHNIDSPDFDLQEKGEAIYMVLNMETHNSVTKASMLEVIRFLFNQVFDVESQEEERHEE